MVFAPLGRRKRAGRRASVGLVGTALVAVSLAGVSATSAVAAPVSYVGRVASGTSAASSTGATLTTGSSVAAGDTLLVSVLLSSTSPISGAVSVTDTAGNAYAVDRDQNDAGGSDRVLVLSAKNVQALPAGGQITFGFPKAAEYHISADEFAGVIATDKSSSAWGTSSSFSSGATATTSQPSELLFGVVGNESGAAASWGSGWTPLPTLSISTDRLGAAFQTVNAVGQYAASGSITGTWMAAVVTYTAGPPPENPPTAKLSVRQTSPLTVTADATKSTDTDLTPIASYSFDFGDHTPPVTTSPPTATAQHTYAAQGTYTVTLTVTDTGNNPSSPATASIVVTNGSPESPPVAKLSVTKPSSPPLTVTADASGSTDTDATPIATYRFDFGDSTPAVTTSTPTATAQHTYAVGGTYTITLTATDTANLTSSPVTANVTVSAGPATAVYVGYYDTHHSNRIQPKPNPWKGSSNVVFVGQSDASTGRWDTSTVRVDNRTGAPLPGVVVTVDIGSKHYALWGTNTIPAGGSLILAQTSKENFDGSDTSPAGCYSCNPDMCTSAVVSTKPVVHVTVGGQKTDYTDTKQILNTRGADGAGCPYTGTRNDESEAWVPIG